MDDTLVSVVVGDRREGTELVPMAGTVRVVVEGVDSATVLSTASFLTEPTASFHSSAPGDCRAVVFCALLSFVSALEEKTGGGSPPPSTEA